MPVPLKQMLANENKFTHLHDHLRQKKKACKRVKSPVIICCNPNINMSKEQQLPSRNKIPPPSTKPSDIVSNFSLPEYLFVVGSTFFGGVVGHSVAYPKNLKAASSLLNGAIAGSGALCVCYLRSYGRLQTDFLERLNKEHHSQ